MSNDNAAPVQHSYITAVRGTTLLCTAICILAVDFHAFPRRFCKAEKFGQGKIEHICNILHFTALHHSVHVLVLELMFKSVLTCCRLSHISTASFVAGSGLMDIGVGAFIFSSGISAKLAPLSESMKLYKGCIRSLQRNSLLLILGKYCSERRQTLARSLYVCTLYNNRLDYSFLACCDAGLVRLSSVKTLDYQEHASEYGVHWNFFLTVAAVSTVMALVPIPQSHSLAAGSWL